MAEFLERQSLDCCNFGKLFVENDVCMYVTHKFSVAACSWSSMSDMLAKLKFSLQVSGANPKWV